ncbi:MAG TPA: exodeoxyribonuclease V subunit gamma [Polyangiaceae bacterium]|nr:exodeoxyribonuclease V subunit gamma [Polyangiaceae bacterium]
MPATVHIYRSNRMELLTAELIRFIAEPLANPLAPERFVVQGRGMALYLMMEIARRLGVCANTQFDYPRHFVTQALDSVLGASSGSAPPLDRTGLRWLVLAELDAQLSHPDFARLRDFLADDPQGLKRLGLATRIAQAFDQYLTYRPELIRAWETHPGDDSLPREQRWQPLLWRALCERSTLTHLPAQEARFHQALATSARFSNLPERVCVFGVSTLPPLYVRLLGALASRVDVRLFLLSPCQEFWADLPAERRSAQRAPMEFSEFDSTHPLLASLGKLGADFQTLLSQELERIGIAAIEHELYQASDASSLLGRAQNDILYLGAESQGSANAAAAPRDPSDDSLTFHSCHSPMRQVQVLHDQLLAIMSREPDVLARDIIVMMPDVETFAPYIEAVFARHLSDKDFIPYQIADRSLYRQSPLVDAFLRILRQVGGRAKASEVLDLLALPPVAAKFGLAQEQVEKLARWVTESNIRWGVDAEHRARQDQPETDANTWRFGLARLFVGYAAASHGRTLFNGVLPYDEIEGQDASLLGTLAEFSARLFETLSTLDRARPLEDWQTALGSVLEKLLLLEGPYAWQAQKVRAALARLRELASSAGFSGELSTAAITRLLEEELDETEHARGFLAGGVTFSALVPMRSIPFKVVCLLGMNEESFPRRDTFIDFDLTRTSQDTGGVTRTGDRSRRDDDRYLFLEALVSARRRLLILFTGQSIRDNARVPPSVLVSELLEHVSERLADGGDVRQALWIEHPLQPFSVRYFDGTDPRLFSYRASYCEGARSLRAETEQAAPLIDAPLPDPEAPVTEPLIALGELLRFFEGPVRYLLNRRLHVYLSEHEIDIPDREPWELSKLDEWSIGRALLALELDPVRTSSYELVRASGELPLGSPGRFIHDVLLQNAEPIAQRVLALAGGKPLPSVAVDVTLPGPVRLSGVLGERWAAGQILAQYSRVSGKHLLNAWIRHLALCSAEPAAVPRTVLIGRPRESRVQEPFESFEFGEVQDPQRELVRLVDLYRKGCSQPLLLFPKSSFEYAFKLHQKQDRERALIAATASWRQTGATGELLGEVTEPHLQRVFGEIYEPGAQAPFPVPPELGFEALAEAVFAPLLAHLTRPA